MAILQVKDIDDQLYESLKSTAKSQNRSISQEVIHIIEKYLQNPAQFSVNQTKEFLSLSGSWVDDQTPEQIIDTIRKTRKNSIRFNKKDGIFD